MQNELLSLTKTLITRPSITPEDASCQQIIADFLTPLGFKIEHLAFGDVKNLWARRGTEQPLFVFAGHTDVVPTGPLDQWQFPPFEPTEHHGFLYGRGAVDMKSSLAAMLIACKAFIENNPNHAGSIAFLITSDEEGAAINGTCKVVELLKSRGENIKWCIIGEPSSEQQFGDIIKIGRRGSLSGELIIFGKQGHIAYPHLAINPIHQCLQALAQLTERKWDQGNEDFPATSFQISNIHGGVGATNVIPGQIEIKFNLRYSPETNAEQIQKTITGILDSYKLNYQLNWQHSGNAFITKKGKLLQATQNVIKKRLGTSPTLSTGGGTSDGRFIRDICEELLELGPVNRTIHQINECIELTDLAALTEIYEQILIQLLQDS